MSEREQFAVVLGGGAARGAAHIGVLLELERIGRTPDRYVGTSIGGIIGALVAADVDLDTIADFIDQLRITRAFSLPRGLTSVTSNKKMERQLVALLGGRPQFSDLKIPTSVVATDLVNRSSYVISRGDVVNALLATSALPGLLPTVKIRGRLLVDGGVTDNVPVGVARKQGATHILAVDLSNSALYGSYAPRTESGSMIDKSIGIVSRYPYVAVLLSVLDTVMAQALNEPEQANDIFLRPKLGTIGLLDFHRVQEGIEAGRMAFRERHAEIEACFAPSTSPKKNNKNLNGNRSYAHSRD